MTRAKRRLNPGKYEFLELKRLSAQPTMKTRQMTSKNDKFLELVFPEDEPHSSKISEQSGDQMADFETNLFKNLRPQSIIT